MGSEFAKYKFQKYMFTQSWKAILLAYYILNNESLKKYYFSKFWIFFASATVGHRPCSLLRVFGHNDLRCIIKSKLLDYRIYMFFFLFVCFSEKYFLFS